MRKILSRTEIRNIIEYKCKLKGEFILRSGQISNYYFDKYLFESDIDLLYQICWTLKYQISNNFDFLAGLEMGGIPLATMLGFIMHKPVLFVRKEAKTYGTKKLVEGGNFDGRRVCIIEDVVTSGGQVIKSANDLKNLGANVTQVVSVILRDQEGRKNIEDAGYLLYTLFDF